MHPITQVLLRLFVSKPGNPCQTQSPSTYSSSACLCYFTCNCMFTVLCVCCSAHTWPWDQVLAKFVPTPTCPHICMLTTLHCMCLYTHCTRCLFQFRCVHVPSPELNMLSQTSRLQYSEK
jgi:hypothetical protein